MGKWWQLLLLVLSDFWRRYDHVIPCICWWPPTFWTCNLCLVDSATESSGLDFNFLLADLSQQVPPEVWEFWRKKRARPGNMLWRSMENYPFTDDDFILFLHLDDCHVWWSDGIFPSTNSMNQPSNGGYGAKILWIAGWVLQMEQHQDSGTG